MSFPQPAGGWAYDTILTWNARRKRDVVGCALDASVECVG